MLNISKNNIITITRGDSFKLPVALNVGTASEPKYYDMTEFDMVFFAILQPNESWENALVKKTFNYADCLENGNGVIVEFSPEDTESIVPGNYFYQIKLLKGKDPEWKNHESVVTIIPRTRMFILE